MTDVLLTHSYFLRFDPKQLRAGAPYPPLGTLYAASYLRQGGVSVSLFDAMLAESENELLDAIERERPAIVCIYDDDFNYLTKMCLTRMREAAFSMIEIARKAGAAVIVHGSDQTDHSAEYLERGAMAVVVGEGEETLLECCREILCGHGTALDSIAGAVVTRDGAIVRGPARRLRRNLDELPFPAWDLIDASAYRRIWVGHHGAYSVNLVTTRGCPYHCNWCAKPIYGQVYASRSPQSVVDELSHLASTLSPDHVWFADDIFGLRPGWIEEFADGLERAGLKVPFRCLSRADLLLQRGTVEALARAGCETVWIGAESGSQKILDAMEKGTTVGQIHQAANLLKHHGIRVAFFLQFGYPGEGMEDIANTIRMVRECLPDEIGISVSYPLPGTKFYDRVREEMGTKRNWIDSNDLDMMFAGRFTPAFYRRLHVYVHNDFQVHRAFNIGLCLLRGASMRLRDLRTLVLLPHFLVNALRHRSAMMRLASIRNPRSIVLERI